MGVMSYKELGDRPRSIILDLKREGEMMCLCAVDTNGSTVATLVEFPDNGFPSTLEGAKDVLESEGYDISFWKWGPMGEMIIS